MKINYPHVLNRICAPLAIRQREFQSILAFLGPRIGVDFQVPITAEVLEEAGEPRERNFGDIPDNLEAIEVSGPLVRKASGMDAWCGMASYEQLERDFTAALADPRKQGILLLFDSPGGEVGALFDLADLIYGSRGQKPIYAAVSEQAFSAAYALASACDRIFLTRTAGVGSIGVFTMHVDVSEMDKKEGIACTYIFAGAKKVDGNPHEPLSSNAKDTIQSEVDRTYDLFVQTVARNRGLAAKQIRSTEAGLFFGDEGVAAGLADQVGTVADAVAAIQAVIEKGVSVPDSRAAEAVNSNGKEEAMKEPKPAALAAATDEKCEPEEMEEKKGKGAKAKASEKDEDDEDEDEEEDDKKAAESHDPKQIAMLCKLAGRSDLLTGFIEKGTSVADVQKALISAQAETEQKPGVIGHHVSLTGPNPLDTLDQMAKSRAASTGKSYSHAYAEVLKENPKLYTGYLDRKDAALAGVK